jgi:Phage tail lysozyme
MKLMIFSRFSLVLIMFILLLNSFNPLVYAYSSSDLLSVLKGTPYYDGSDGCGDSNGATNSTPNGITTGSNVYILGDSITAASSTAYYSAFSSKGIKPTVDGSSSRSIVNPGVDGNKLNGMDAVSADKAYITGASAIVIALGTNGGDTPQSIDGLINSIRNLNHSSPIYWVDTIVVNRPDYDNVIETANKAIYSQSNIDNYTVISWFKLVDPNGDPQKLTGSEKDSNNYIRPMSDIGSLGVHPTESGINALTKLVVGTVSSGSTDTSSSSSCCSSSSSSTLVGTDNLQKAYNYFVSKGFTPAQSAGIVGNLNLESGVEPEKLEGGQVIPYEKLTPAQISDSGLGWGIAQFTPPSSFGDSVKGTNKDPNSLQVQLDFIWQVLQAKDIKNPTKTYVQAIQATTTTDDAATVFMNDYERPLIDATHDGGLPARKAYAKQILQQYGGGTGGSVSSCGDTTSPVGVYQNPFRDVKNIVGNRIDQGVDYDGDGNVYAIGNGTINGIFQNWYLTEPFISYSLSDGPAQGKTVYVAECITLTPEMSVGKKVSANTVIAVMNNVQCRNGIESGWAKTDQLPLSMAYQCWDHTNPSTYGINFSNLIKSLGGPSGIYPTNSTSCTLDSSWPKF